MQKLAYLEYTLFICFRKSSVRLLQYFLPYVQCTYAYYLLLHEQYTLTKHKIAGDFFHTVRIHNNY